MEGIEIEPNSARATEIQTETQDVSEIQSSENFQKFIYELFDKNGILNDLRAYLRGHIVNVLKSAQTGDPPVCQKHFTQRLELTFQALNMLVAEYLLCLEFSYTLSVFVSEIPLANMVFEFSKTLLLNAEMDSTGLRFRESDVWSILNYLGIKCDSNHATNIMHMYKNDKQTPLLLCILKCKPMYHHKEAGCIEQLNSSEETLSSSVKSSDSIEKCTHKTGSYHEKCKHYAFCKICQNRLGKLRDKYRKRKKMLTKMFQQLKTVYEAEVEMVKVEEEKKVKRSLASHALQLKRHQNEIEEAFRAREEELERNVQQKKKFLWGLARALRDQHEHMSRAMLAVQHETERLTAKETSLKTQLLEAEETLRKRGEDMRSQISSELAILEEHLDSMKKERENIYRERSELEQLKEVCDSSSKVIKIHNMDANEDVRSHYDLLKDELSVLRKYLESTKVEARCVIERSTMTELNDVMSKDTILNNEQDDRSYTREEERAIRTPNQVVNDFKKAKNVNFSQISRTYLQWYCQSNLDEIYRERSRERSRSSASSEAGDATATRSEHDFARERDHARDRDSIQRLRDENERLRTYARQQRDRIDELTNQYARVQAELSTQQVHMNPWRPRTAPAVMPHTHTFIDHSMYATSSASASGNTFGWRKGAGEELSLFSNAQPRILLPGDTIPFIGVLRDRHNDCRRHLISQWRSLRRRVSPQGCVGKMRSVSPARERPQRERPNSAGPSISMPQRPCQEDPVAPPNQVFTYDPTKREKLSQRPRSPVVDTSRHREKSPKSVLREAKERLRNKDNIKECPPATRDKSPNSVLREAKLRLRKLEIEAEAVEKSYLDFRKRQSALKEERKTYSMTNEEAVVTKDVGALEVRRSKSLQKFDDPYRVDAPHHDPYNVDPHKPYNDQTMRDFDKYLREYETKLNIGDKYFSNKSAAAKTKPIPEAFSKMTPDIDKPKETSDNYLETPITEFRKLYRSHSPSRPFRIVDNTPKSSRPRSPVSPINKDLINIDDITKSNEQHELEAIKDAIIMEKNSKKAELEILKRNITKMYNLQETPTVETPEIRSIDDCGSKQEQTINVVPRNDDSDKNVLRVEIETVSEINNLNVTETEPQNLLLVVQSSVNAAALVQSDSEPEGEKINTNMTILISPKRSSPKNNDTSATIFTRAKSPERTRRSVSPEMAARLTRNDVLDAIFHADPMKEVSSLEMHPDVSKDGVDSISEVDKDPRDEYADDFSADVDNYNSRSDYENNSPISLPKTSEDENFWDP